RERARGPGADPGVRDLGWTRAAAAPLAHTWGPPGPACSPPFRWWGRCGRRLHVGVGGDSVREPADPALRLARAHRPAGDTAHGDPSRPRDLVRALQPPHDQ